MDNEKARPYICNSIFQKVVQKERVNVNHNELRLQ